MRTTLQLGLALLLTTPLLACGSDATLRFYLAHSEVVVLGEVVSDISSATEEVGSVSYFCDFQIAEVLRGQGPADNKIAVNIARFELSDADRLPELKRGYRCILFLNNQGTRKTPRWQTADVWFGVQHPSLSLAKSLRRLARVEYTEGRKIDAVQEWDGILADKKLAELVPDNGYVTNQSAWSDLWKAWRPNEKLPEIDFNKHLVIVSLGGIYPVVHEMRLSDQGDLRIWPVPRVPHKKGYGYGITLINRADIKLILGKPVPSE